MAPIGAAFGIDPVGGGLPDDPPSDWPALAQVRDYAREIRQSLDEALSQETPGETGQQFSLNTLLNVAIEHRLMHGGALAVEGFETRVWVTRGANDPRRMKAQAMPPKVVARLRHASLVASR